MRGPQVWFRSRRCARPRARLRAARRGALGSGVRAAATHARRRIGAKGVAREWWPEAACHRCAACHGRRGCVDVSLGTRTHASVLRAAPRCARSGHGRGTCMARRRRVPARMWGPSLVPPRALRRHPLAHGRTAAWLASRALPALSGRGACSGSCCPSAALVLTLPFLRRPRKQASRAHTRGEGPACLGAPRLPVLAAPPRRRARTPPRRLAFRLAVP